MRREAKEKGYATGGAPEGASLIEAMEHRLRTEEGSSLYGMRQHTVEPVFGDAKHNRGFTRFMRRGRQAADSEWKLVSPSGKAAAGGTSCAAARYSSIQAAIEAAAPGSTVVACPGTYHGQVTVIKPLALLGVGATIDAAGSDNGITVPVPHTTVEGFTVEGAIGEGILVVGRPGAPVTGVTVSANVVKGNDLGNPTGRPISSSHYRECNASGKVPGDCGEGIHLMVAAGSVVSGNLVEDNSGGILVTDEFGPSDHNVIEALAAHGPALRLSKAATVVGCAKGSTLLAR